MLLKWALREIFHNWKTSLFFILNLSLGLIGFVTLNAFNVSLQTYLEENAKKLLGADLVVSSRREITADELEKIRRTVGTPLRESQTYEFFAMLKSIDSSRLVSVRALDENFPFYGDLGLESGKQIKPGTPKKINQGPFLWAYPELKYQMDLQLGQTVELGRLKLTLDDFVSKDATQSFRTTAVAPKIFISSALVPESGLIQYGSTYRRSYLYKIDDDTRTEQIKAILAKDILDPAIDIESAKESGDDSGRQLKYLTDYLGLVALIAIFLSSLGSAYVYRLFLSQRLKEIAIYRSLGLQAYQAVSIYVLQAALLGSLAMIPTILGARLLLPLLTLLLNQLVPFELTPQITQDSVFFSFSFAVCISFLVTLPYILKVHDLQISKLFSEEKFMGQLTVRNPWAFLPAFLALWGLSMAQAHSFRIGSIFFFSFLSILILLFFLGWLLFSLFEKNKFKNWMVHYGLKSVSRLRGSSVAAFVALGLGSLLINILPQIKNSLQNEFTFNTESKTPSLFLFDIQDDQIQALDEKVSAEGLQFVSKSPLIRARILKLNGEQFERVVDNPQSFRTREDEQETRFRNRGINLSFRDQLSASETLTAGEPITSRLWPNESRPAKLSIEEGYRDRLGLKLGDLLLFDVQGVEVHGKVVNFRKVQWNSFQPNFFILIEPGALDDAPKTYIAALPRMPSEQKRELQNKLVKQFPNVSILDVERTITEILRIAEQMSWSLELMAALALLVGYVVLYSIIRSQVLQRRWEINMLKILGSSFNQIRWYLVSEAATIAGLAALLGSGLSLLISWILTFWVFKTGYSFSLLMPVISVLIILGFSVVISLLAAQKVLKEKPLVVLRENL